MSEFKSFVDTAEQAELFQETMEQKIIAVWHAARYIALVEGSTYGYVAKNALGEMISEHVLPVGVKFDEAAEETSLRAYLQATGAYKPEDLRGLQLQPMSTEFALSRVQYFTGKLNGSPSQNN